MGQQDLILAEGWDGYGSPSIPITYVLATLWNAQTGQPGMSLPAGAYGNIVERPLVDKLGESISVKDMGAVGNGVSNDTNAFYQASLRAQRVLVPPAPVRWMVADLPLQSGTVLEGCSTPQYSAYNDESYTRYDAVRNPIGVSAIGLATGGSVLVLPRANVTYRHLIFEGFDRTHDFMDRGSGISKIQRQYFFMCGFHRWNRAIYESVYPQNIYTAHCFFSANNTAIRDCVDSQFMGGYVHANESDGIQFNSGASDNIVTAVKVEWNKGRGVRTLDASNNVLTGCIIDRNYLTGLFVEGGHLVAANCTIRRNGRSDDSGGTRYYNVHIKQALKAQFDNINCRTGADDGGGGPNTPPIGCRIEGANTLVMLDQCDFSDSTTPMDRSGATYSAVGITKCRGVADLGNGNFGNLDSIRGYCRWQETAVKVVATTATGTWNITGLAPPPSNSVWPITLRIEARRASGGTGSQIGTYPGAIRNEGGTVVLIWGAGVNRFSAGTLFGSAIPGVDNNFRLSVANLAADGSGFDLSLQNTHADSWNFWLTVLPA